MSELKVNKVVFGDESFQETAADRSFRNKIINGDMSVDQEFAGGATSPSPPAYVIDQFYAYHTQSSRLTFQQVSDAPAGFRFSQKITVASQFSPGSTDQFTWQQKIEGTNVVDLKFGSSGASVVTLSMYIKGSVPGAYCCFLKNGANTRSYVGKVNVTTSWARVSIVIPGDITGTWANDMSTGMIVGIDLGSGSDFANNVGVWYAGDWLHDNTGVKLVAQPNGSTLNITGVQLEKAGAPSEFEYVPYDEQLRRCQRYWHSKQLAKRFYATVSGQFHGDVFSFPTPMRVAPAIATSSIAVSIGVGASVFQNITTLNGEWLVTGYTSPLPITVQAMITYSANARL